MAREGQGYPCYQRDDDDDDDDDYRIINPTFLILNRINDKVERAHSNDLKLSGLKEWEIHEIKVTDKVVRKTGRMKALLEADSQTNIHHPGPTRGSNRSFYNESNWCKPPLLEIQRVDQNKHDTTSDMPVKYRYRMYQNSKEK